MVVIPKRYEKIHHLVPSKLIIDKVLSGPRWSFYPEAADPEPNEVVLIIGRNTYKVKLLSNN